MKLIEGLYYTEEHEWIKVEDNLAYIGITDYAQESLGALVYVELPEIDDEIEKGSTFGVLESVKAASDIYTPLTGNVTEVNEALADEPDLLNQEPYENWLVCVEMSDNSELDNLMSAKEYETFVAKG